jgi:hypothetical protein
MMPAFAFRLRALLVCRLRDPHVADKLAEVRAELRLAQSCADAGLLPRLADWTDFADAVCKIPVLADGPDTVCNFCRATVFRVTCAELPTPGAVERAFPLRWSAYVRHHSAKTAAPRAFYETEALRAKSGRRASLIARSAASCTSGWRCRATRLPRSGKPLMASREIR